MYHSSVTEFLISNLARQKNNVKIILLTFEMITPELIPVLQSFSH